jgi:uncharacterized LabA/DUF88 family protein
MSLLGEILAPVRKAAVLIDGGYFGKVRELVFNRPEIDLLKFSNIICQPYERFRTYFYDALPWQDSPPTTEQTQRMSRKQGFLDSLKMLDRFEVRIGRVQKVEILCSRGPPHVKFDQKLVDVLLSVDMVRLAWSKQVEMIVLVSGDSDFVPAVKAAKEAGMTIRLVYSVGPNVYAHTELLQSCDERLEITQDLINQCKRGKMNLSRDKLLKV